MSKTNRTIPFLLTALACLPLEAAIAHGTGKANVAYVGDSGGHLISDSSGDCVRTGSWSKDKDLVDCGAPPPVKAMAAEPAAMALTPLPRPKTVDSANV